MGGFGKKASEKKRQHKVVHSPDEIEKLSTILNRGVRKIGMEIVKK